jgi:polar amino acid transport system permease protein
LSGQADNIARRLACDRGPIRFPEASIQYSFSWEVLLDYRGLLLRGLLLTIELSILGFVLSAALGIVVGLCRLSSNRLVSTFARAYVEFFRNVPLVVQIFFLYFGLGMGSFAAGLLGIVLYSAPFVAEVIRSGIASIPRAQYEAAHASGLGPLQVARHVILPQAIAIVLPPLATEAVNLVKNTAIALTVGVEELTFMTQEIDSITFRGFEAATAATVTYVVLCLVILQVVALLERHLKVESRVM